MSTHIPACVLLIAETSQGQSVNYDMLERYQFQSTERHGLEDQGLRHGQSHHRLSHSYLKHGCHTHSYAFTPLHPRLYLVVSPQLPGPKNTEVRAYPPQALILTFVLCGNSI